LLNILERKFILFGQVFWPQDFHLVVLSLITLIVFIILFTVIFGRLFCGWVCPQTVFMEFVFSQIEYLIEGDFSKQKNLARAPWNFEKIWKKSLKHSCLLCNSFFDFQHFSGLYHRHRSITGNDNRWSFGSYRKFHCAGIFSGVFYFIFAFFREQVCIIACPYGRLQGVLLDSKSIVVAYDYKRGEPKGKHNLLENRAASGKGDCIDCLSCVSICPTGIDIRNGTQLECINCTACIDACDSIMDRVGLKRGLIRYDSEKGISEGKRKLFNTRSIAYSAVLSVLLLVVGGLFTFRSDVEATIIRLPGTQFQEYGANFYSNLYKMQLVNKTKEDLPIDIVLENPQGEIQYLNEKIFLKSESVGETNFMVILPKDIVLTSNIPLEFGIYSEGRLITKYKLNFVGPNTLDYN
jgi:cytochrome c oxidase accessory protein FixG